MHEKFSLLVFSQFKLLAGHSKQKSDSNIKFINKRIIKTSLALGAYLNYVNRLGR